MIVGKVLGNVISTRKSEKLIGNKFMIIEPVESMGKNMGQLVAIDNIGAGVGEYVLVSLGSAARIGTDNESSPVDAAIVGILDEGEPERNNGFK
ncbi:MAG: EutN/CcmL family microcompartment protein [Lachnospiraceae bacterium]|nr:EutN/CcmL family microcompartment protein [Lachnospiraceae bacterium]